MTYIHIHAPAATDRKLWRHICLDCGKNAYRVSFFTPWYGWDSTCLKCGRHWQDGEWMALDFMRGARQKSIDSAKKQWRRMAKNPALLQEDKPHE
jgi:hypothetical protein